MLPTTADGVVFGCHGLKHSLAPDLSSLALTAIDELPGQWLNVVRFPIERDWSFLGLETEAVRIARTIELVGELRIVAIAQRAIAVADRRCPSPPASSEHSRYRRISLTGMTSRE